MFKFGLGFYFNIEEGFTNDLIHRFLNYQKTVNENNHHFDMSILEKQVSPKEMESYLSSGYWNWDDELKQVRSEQEKLYRKWEIDEKIGDAPKLPELRDTRGI